jgi:integrase/recombinase XerC
VSQTLHRVRAWPLSRASRYSYLSGNPFALRRRRGQSSMRRRAAVERSLDHRLWQAVLDVLETLPHGMHRRRGKGWLQVVGQDGAARDVTMSDALMADLARYQQFHGLAPEPSAIETTPLVMSVAGRIDQGLTPKAIYLLVKEVFRRGGGAPPPIGCTTPRIPTRPMRATTSGLSRKVLSSCRGG